jgi:hypothetical protein
VLAAIEIVTLPLIILAVAVVVWLIWRPRRAGLVQAPTCGRCGYCVRGLPTFTCPECGADLREAGIVGPGMRPALSRNNHLLIWTLLLPVPAVVFSSLLIVSLTPRVCVLTMHRWVNGQSADLRASVLVTMKGQARRWPWSSIEIPLETMEIANRSGGPSKISVDLVRRTYRYPDAAGREVAGSGDVDEQVLADWLPVTGVKTDSPKSRECVQAMLQAIREVPQAQTKWTELAPDPQSKLARINAPSSYSYIQRHAPWWVSVPVWAFWVVVWLIGVRAILGRHRVLTLASSSPAGA